VSHGNGKFNLVAVALLLGLAALGASGQATAVTLTGWAGAPGAGIVAGDKLFTLISTDFGGVNNVTTYDYTPVLPNYYGLSLEPVSTTGGNRVLANTTKHLVYKVTIINNPATPQNEAVLNSFGSIDWDGNRYIASGTFTVTGVFDDNSNFSSPFLTISNSATPAGPYVVPGQLHEIYVSLTYTASGGSTILTSHSVNFRQNEETVPTQKATWGQVKALY